ncbi:MAG: ROK family protein [Deltaproteobacteria bacterium]|nr:ROK family protein [Deltaproteobacteria bacterium]
MEKHDARVGVDLGGTKTEAVVIRYGGIGTPYDVLARKRIPTATADDDDETRYARILESTRDLVADVVKEASLRAMPPIGVGMPGSSTLRAPDGGRAKEPLVKNSNTTCLNGRPFHADLSRAVGHPIAFANDANCFALAEAVWGAAAGARVAFGVIMGTGVGGGVVVRDGLASGGRARAWEGAQGIAGEWGHVVLDPDTGPRCYCGRRGCIETYLSGPAIEAAYAARAGETDTARSLPDIASLAQAGDAAAASLLAERMDLFGRAIAGVLNTLDPDVVVLGGGVSNLDVLYTDGVAAAARWIFNDELRTKIVKNQLGDSAGVLGAALLP